ncbi:MAG: PadR family transcriptional regulator [Lysobacter sp.]
MTDLDPLLRKFQKELSAGTVSLALMAVMAAAAEPMYGYQIAKRLEHIGEGVLAGKQSALYPVLRNLGAAGLLDSFVEPSDAGPPRRYYRITAFGREVLQAWTAAWRATRDSVDAVLAPVIDASTPIDPSNAPPTNVPPNPGPPL